MPKGQGLFRVFQRSIRRAYGVADLIHWEDVYFRKDIGAKALRRVK